MSPRLQHNLDCLRRTIGECGSVLVAYSGGVDSALVATLASRQLGPRALACVGVSPSYPRREQRAAVEFARSQQIAYRQIETHEDGDANYAANPPNRCYFCKVELYDRLRAIAAAEGWETILDGSHLDDIGDHVGGLTAARKVGVRSPLIEAQMRKSDVRELARELGLTLWNKPAMACLSSRISHGTPITAQLLRQVEAAEDVLFDLSFQQFRVRHHGEVARIELPPDDLPRALAMRQRIIAGIRQAGYRHVALDLAGFRDESAAPALVAVGRSVGRPATPTS